MVLYSPLIANYINKYQAALSPVVSDIVLQGVEKGIKKLQLLEFSPIFHQWYVDDILGLVSSEKIDVFF